MEVDSASNVELQSRVFHKFGLPIAKLIAGFLFLIFGPLRVRGKYRVPPSGGLLILCNHIADLDPPAVQVGCARTVYFMAKSELFEVRFLGRILRWFRAFPVKRGEPDRAALKTAVDYLKAGQAVCIFPEGELSETGELIPLKSGVALVARMADVPVICSGVRGTNKILPYGSLFPRPAFGGVELSWGEARKFEKGVKPEEFLAWAAAQLRELSGQ